MDLFEDLEPCRFRICSCASKVIKGEGEGKERAGS